MSEQPPLMTVDHEHMDYATECVRLAALTGNLEVRDQLLELAGRRLADARDERCRQSDNVISLSARRR
jgi:hypothetical protein